ncbi:hypothetical protein LCGC14_2774100, partial [marine sediment metagenome]
RPYQVLTSKPLRPDSASVGVSGSEDERLAEGLVMRPVVDLFDRKGNRIIAKVKAKDFR